MKFEVVKKDISTNARIGVLELAHGKVGTPVFMPVGTNGTVKALRHNQVSGIGFNLMLSNTYHLFLRPGRETIRLAGGLHSFMGWPHNILTDSGGFQIFSLSPFRKIVPEHGIRFRSHIDGTMFSLTPEDVLDVQKDLGSDICMPLDVCTEPGISYKKALEAAAVTTAWALRSKLRGAEYGEDGKPVIFGIVQGNFYKDLRKKSAEELLELEFPGMAIGGLSVGEEPQVFADFLHYTASILPESLPHYVMGIGTPQYMLEAVEAGIDMFDCVLPTRIARNGTVFTSRGPLALKKDRNKHIFEPIDETCPCTACTEYTVAFLRHLFKCNEILGPMLATEHNLYFINRFMHNIRLSIETGQFKDFKNRFLEEYRAGKNERSTD